MHRSIRRACRERKRDVMQCVGNENFPYSQWASSHTNGTRSSSQSRERERLASININAIWRATSTSKEESQCYWNAHVKKPEGLSSQISTLGRNQCTKCFPKTFVNWTRCSQFSKTTFLDNVSCNMLGGWFSTSSVNSRVLCVKSQPPSKFFLLLPCF